MRKQVAMIITTVCFVIGLYGGNRFITRKK